MDKAFRLVFSSCSPYFSLRNLLKFPPRPTDLITFSALIPRWKPLPPFQQTERAIAVKGQRTKYNTERYHIQCTIANIVSDFVIWGPLLRSEIRGGGEWRFFKKLFYVNFLVVGAPHRFVYIFTNEAFRLFCFVRVYHIGNRGGWAQNWGL